MSILKSNKIEILLLFFFVIIFNSCKNTSSITAGIPKLNSFKLNKVIEKKAYRFDVFNCKTRVNFDGQTFTANIRMKKDSIIWISLTGPFNIEGARIIIENDRFQMIDKLNRVYYDENISFVKQYFPVELDMETLEKIIVGNFLEKKVKQQKVETKDDNYIVKGNIGSFETEYLLNKNGRINRVEIANKTDLQEIETDYTKYELVDNQLFSMKRNFRIKRNGKENTLNLKFYNIDTKETKYPFTVLSQYRKTKQ